MINSQNCVHIVQVEYVYAEWTVHRITDNAEFNNNNNRNA